GMLLSLPIVAASIPIGVGAALALKQAKRDDVAVVYLGDASVEEGVFHESANFAAVHHLPVLFVCENNLYSVYTPLQERQPPRPIADLGRAHGLHAVVVDGNDVIAVRRAASDAVRRARAGMGPTFIEAATYRWREHCGPNFDNTLGYRSEAEFEAWKRRDPVESLGRHLSEHSLLSESQRSELTAEIAAEIAAAFADAEAAPYPAPDTADHHVYAG
ncbi:MAG: thiamine pyrophosphate-dependent dehydrogenase E1 component subunit alpha, partial [Stellaceae bacterium]